MAGACAKGCRVCGGRNGGPHTGACCAGMSCSAPPADRYDEDVQSMDSIVQVAQQLVQAMIERRARDRLIAAQKEQVAKEQAERLAADEAVKAELRAAAQAREQALRERQAEESRKQAIRDGSKKPRVEYTRREDAENVEQAQTERVL